jgi:hypothetical protein
VTAIGPDDPANGAYRGNSLPSQVLSGYCQPPNPPLIQIGSFTQGNGAVLLMFTTDLPTPASPLGPSAVDLLKAAADPAHPGRTLLNVVLSSAPDAIGQGMLALPPVFPKRFPPPYLGPALAKSVPDAQAQWTL